MNALIQGDSQEVLRELPEGSIDLIVTDPPYGYRFMNSDWDKAVPSVELWKECYRVLKPGAFAFVMSAPRCDVQRQMIQRLEEAGFRMDFTPIYWCYSQGFPKAANIGKLVDKRNGVEREVIGTDKNFGITKLKDGKTGFGDYAGEWNITKGTSPLEGSYAGFQPKPAVEVILVCMKPLEENTYIDQALKNMKGISWLDDARIPEDEESRFPANLLCSDNVLNGHSKYFSLDKWAETHPFICVPKASKSEKNKGCEDMEERQKWLNGGGGTGITDRQKVVAKNFHPTCKPVKLMSYLITLGSREGDVILDPFVGSGTSCVAAKLLKRNYIGIDLSNEYLDIAEARLEATQEPLL